MGMMYFEDLNVGDSWASSECPVDHDEMLTYGRTNEPWPIHVNPEAAAKSPFGGLIASGGYTISLMYRLSHEIVNQPDRTWAFLGGFDWHVKFLEPVRSGDRLHERITILEKRLSSKPGRGIVKHFMELINDRKRVVFSRLLTCCLRERWYPERRNVMVKITKRVVEAAGAREKDYLIWDDELPGFGLRVFSSGKRSYVIQYRTRGISRRYTIGLHGAWAPETARREAKVHFVDLGKSIPHSTPQNFWTDPRVSGIVPADLPTKLGDPGGAALRQAKGALS